MSVAPRQGVQIFAGAGRMRWTPGDREGKARLSGSWWLQRRRRIAGLPRAILYIETSIGAALGVARLLAVT